MQTNLGTKPADQATFYEETALRLLQATMTCNGDMSPEAHISLAFKVADQFVSRLSQRTGEA